MRWRTCLKILLATGALLIALPIIACTLAWTTWPWWSDAVLRQLLAGADIELQHIAWPRPRWHMLHIEQIALTVAKSTRPVVIAANDVTAEFTLSTLRNRRLVLIDIARLHAGVQPALPGAEKSATMLPLPGELLARIPAATLHIRDLNIATPWTVKHGPAIPAWRGNVDFRDEMLSLALSDTDTGQLVLHLAADTRNQIDLSLRKQHRQLFHLRNQFEKLSTTDAQIQLHGELHADLAALAQLAPPELLPLQKLDGTINADWRGSMPRALDAQLLENLNATGAISAHIDAAHTLAPAAIIDVSSDFAIQKGIINGIINTADGRADIVPPAAIAALFALKPKKLLPATLNIKPQTRYSVDLHTRSLQMNPAELQLDIGNKGSAIATHARVDRLGVQMAGAPRVELHATIKSPALPMAGMHLQPASLEADVQADATQLSATWLWRDLARIYRLHGELRHRFDSGSGDMRAQLPALAFRENGNYLPAIFRHWRWPMDFSSGEMRADLRAQWSAADLSGNASVELRDLGGFYDHNLIRGANGVVYLDYRQRQILPRAQKLSIDRVDAGVTIANIHAAITSTPKAITLADFSAQAFGGTLSQPRIEYVWGQPEQSALLHIDNLQLDQILALQQNVEGTGVLDGTVPLRLRNGKPSVGGARLQARAPGGTLRYRGELPASANQGLTLAFTALQNFHYHTMNVRGDYAESGDMTLGVELQGRNPDARGTPPVNFNLNIHENIPDLLRSLQLGGAISDRIEQRIKTLREKQQRSSSP